KLRENLLLALEDVEVAALADRLERELARPGFGQVRDVNRPDVLGVEGTANEQRYEAYLSRVQQAVDPRVIGKLRVERAEVWAVEEEESRAAGLAATSDDLIPVLPVGLGDLVS